MAGGAVTALAGLEAARWLGPKATGVGVVRNWGGHSPMVMVILVTMSTSLSLAQVKALTDAVAFVNWRRLEKRQPPVLAVAYEHA